MDIIRSDGANNFVEDGGFAPLEDQASISKLISVAGAVGQDVKSITQSLSSVLGEKMEKNCS